LTFNHAMVRIFLLATALTSSARPGAADVVESSRTAFIVKSVASIAAPPDKVYDALVKDVGRWWDPEHTFSGDSRNLSIDARPGGCFCERLERGGGVQHAIVIFAAPGQMLRLTGALGPLQEGGLAAALSWALAKAPEGTQMTLTYVVGGQYPGGLTKIAPAVDAVLRAQLERLKRFVERGTPTP